MSIEAVARLALVTVTVVTWYGPDCADGNPYIASWWHNELPDGAPAIVDYGYLGAATASREIPFGTEICLEIVDIPDWAKGEYDHLIGRSVIVTVVDRMRDSNGNRFDLWPAAARKLMGPDYKRVGVVYARAGIPESNENRNHNRYLQAEVQWD